MGRKKHNYSANKKMIYCSDPIAWDIIKKKGIDISPVLSRYINFLAYGCDNTIQQKQMIVDQIKALKIEKERELRKIQSKYASLIGELQETLNKLNNK